MEILRCTTEVLPLATVVRLNGEIDLSTRGTLLEALESAAQGRHVIVDLEGVTYLDGGAVRLFERVRRRCEAQGVSLVLVRVPRYTERIFQILDVRPPLPAFDSVHAALRALRGESS